MTSFLNSTFIIRAEQRLTTLIQNRRHSIPRVASVQSAMLAPDSINEHTLRDIGIEQAVMINAIRAEA